jgi:glutathione S-transferase
MAAARDRPRIASGGIQSIHRRMRRQSNRSESMYTLYYSPGAASMIIHLALLETGAAYRLQLIDTASGQQRSAEYLKLNPNGVVPTLLIDGTPFFEAAAGLMTVADRHPASGLAPPTASLDRAAWNQWILHLANVVQPAFRLWFYPSDLSDDESVQAAIKQGVRRNIETAWSRIDAHLASHGPYLLGEALSAADLMLLVLMRWSRNMPKPATEWPALNAFATRMKQRPSWKRLCEVEGLIEWA